jgi:hypothetical protein
MPLCGTRYIVRFKTLVNIFGFDPLSNEFTV